MKLHFVWIIFFSQLFNITLKAQVVEVLDTAYIKVTYDYSRQYKPARPQATKDLLILAIGKNHSSFYSPYTFEYDSLNASREGQIRHTKMFNDAFRKGVIMYKKYGNYTYKNFPKGITFVADNISIESFIYKDKLHDQSWHIQDSTKVVMGYECQLATTNYRGRKWLVWFCSELPINNGPWLLGGLPGLILEAGDEENLFHFTAIGIEKVKKSPIYYIPKPMMKEPIKTTREDFLKADMRMFVNPMSVIEAQTSIKLGEDQPKTESYEPIEFL